MNRHVPIALAMAVLISANAYAVPIFSNPLSSPFSGFGSNDPASLPSDQQVADDFVLASNDTIRSITWWGNYSNDEAEAGTTTVFTVRFFNDDGSGMSPLNTAPFFSENVIVFASTTGISTTGDDREIFSYTANIQPIPVSGGTTYWLSVVESDPTTVNETWEWTSTTTGSGAINVLRHPPDNWFTAPAQRPDQENRPFTLYNSFEAASPVPESGEPIVLLCGGLVAIVLFQKACIKAHG